MDLRKFKYILLFLPIILFSACEAEIDEFQADAGELDLTTFVTIGNSLTAGFADNALYRSGQINSMGNILAGQLMHTGLSEFNQPLMKDELGLGGRLVLSVVGGSLLPVPMPGEPDPANFENIFESEGPFHNMGVPGAQAEHLLAPGYATMNPYFGRFASSPATSVFDDAIAMEPTFFSLWTGSNNILSYALGGGEGLGITPTANFQQAIMFMLSQLTANGAKGVIGNIPGVTVIPFFNTIPYNAIVIEDQIIVDILNNAYSEAPHVVFELGPNPLVVVDEDHPAGFRQLEEGERVLITAMSGIIEENWGTQVFLPAEYYLSLEQMDVIENAVDSYNNIIDSAADQFNLALVDANTLLKKTQSGIFFDALEFNTEFVTGGAFSLDAVHLSARGNAIVANAFIEAINSKYNANIPKALVSDYPGIIFP